jgi:putative oxidoreductase
VDAIDVSLLLIRGLIGVPLIGHGLRKLTHFFGGSGLRGARVQFEAMGYRPPYAMAALAGSTELVGGTLMTLGAATPAAAAAIVGVMASAIWHVNRANGFWVANNGVEFPLVIILVAVAVALSGPGAISIDATAGAGWHGYVWAAGALCLGVLGAVVITVTARRSPA